MESVVLEGWDGLKLTSARVSLVVVPEPGGRVLSLTLDGVEVLFVNPLLGGRGVDLASVTDVRAAKREIGWLHYGGYKNWLAPQGRWTDGLPFLDLDSGAYTVELRDHDTIRLTSPVCRETGFQLGRTVSLSADGRVAIEQSMTNRGEAVASWGLWDVTQVRGPGVAVLPVARDSALPGGVKACGNEGRSAEVMAAYVTVDADAAIVTCAQVEPFKYGTLSGAVYPHGTTAEVFDTGQLPYFEIEVHSPVVQLEPGQSYSYVESWFVDWVPDAVEPQEWARGRIAGGPRGW